MQNEKLIGNLSAVTDFHSSLNSYKPLSATLNAFSETLFVDDYDKLNNKPSINGVELINNLTSSDLNITDVIVKTTYLEFPNIGRENNIYIDSTENTTYRWNAIDNKYYIIGSNYRDIKIIDGGNANG